MGKPSKKYKAAAETIDSTRAYGLEDGIGDVSRMITYGSNTRMRKYDRRFCHSHRLSHCLRGNMRQVHQHAKAVHFQDHFTPKI